MHSKLTQTLTPDVVTALALCATWVSGLSRPNSRFACVQSLGTIGVFQAELHFFLADRDSTSHFGSCASFLTSFVSFFCLFFARLALLCWRSFLVSLVVLRAWLVLAALWLRGLSRGARARLSWDSLLLT